MTLLDEKSLKKHLLKSVGFLIYLFIDFGAKSERADLEFDMLFIDPNACAPFSNVDLKIIDLGKF